MIGIIGAMEEEVIQLKEQMNNPQVCNISGMTFYKGELCSKEVVVVRSGIGKVNAAACAQTLAVHFNVSTIINTGIAGSLNNKIDIGDVVISTDTIQHDVDAREFGYPLGQIPRVETFSFPTNKELGKKACQANEIANPTINTHMGRIATGDQFIASQEIKDNIVNNFEPLCAEMEGAAIAQVAYLNEISCLIIRAISDKADNSASVDYPTFEKAAIQHSIRLLIELLSQI